MGGESVPFFYIFIAFLCTIGATSLAIFHIYRHLLNYTEPTYQRYIVRIIFMVPLFAVMSFLSLVFPERAIYFNSIREVYEAWVIYNFLSLCLAWVGGPGAVVLSLSGRVLKPSVCLMTCCLPPVPLDGDLLHPFNPVPKFIMIKSVVFLTYWQGVLVFLAAKSGLIENTDEAAKFQDFILCIEMLIAAVGHLFAFPYKEYAGANIGGSRGLTGSLAHALKLNDFYHDTVHQFAPTYHDYVLYNHNEGDEGTRKYRSRTFVPTGHEMDAVRRNKLDEIQLSSVSSSDASTPKHSSTMPDTAHSDAIKSSLLVDVSNSLSAPYDMALIDIDMSSYPAKVPAAKENETRAKARLIEQQQQEATAPAAAHSSHKQTKKSKTKTKTKAKQSNNINTRLFTQKMALVLYNHQSHNNNMLYMNMNAYEEYMEKRQLFLRSYQFCRKKSLTERMRASLFRVKRVIWLRLKNARRIRKLVWSRLRFICRRRRRFVRLMNQHNYYNNYYSTSNNNNSSCFW
ncbi:hypothetical protein KPL70_016886 [Citrus sinensis]|nr:hypothetical protein KPL70_016886 [Citrus sinensis]